MIAALLSFLGLWCACYYAVTGVVLLRRWLGTTPTPPNRARHTVTGPVYLGGSVRVDPVELLADAEFPRWPKRPSEIVADAYGVTVGQWLHAYEGPVRYMTVDQLIDASRREM